MAVCEVEDFSFGMFDSEARILEDVGDNVVTTS